MAATREASAAVVRNEGAERVRQAKVVAARDNVRTELTQLNNSWTRFREWNITLESHVLDGNTFIKNFDLLTRFVNRDDMLNISASQAFIALPKFLADPANSQFRTKLSGEFLQGGIKGWPEAIEYVLHTYAITFAMGEGLEDFRNVKQDEHEKEQ